jgi:hypothetical protein
MQPHDLPTNEKVDTAVKQYANAIIAGIRVLDPLLEMDIDYSEAMNDNETYKATICDIQTEFGFVTIFPDFAEESSKAALLNRGMIGAMELEGFDDDAINNSPVYGTLTNFSPENVDVFVLVLTNDFGLQHQKNL